jgi:HAE1 family hydrophobic/amphiphilic exporter-1
VKFLVDGSVRQPITVAVGVILALLAGVVAFTSVPIQLAPQVDSTVVTVQTQWPNATPEEIESDILEEQEDVLADIDSLISMIGTARTGSAEIRLQFRTGINIDDAVAAVDQKLAQVPFYPDGVSNPVIENRDPQSIDYIAWVGLSSSDPNFNAYLLGDFMERVLRPRFERIPGVSEVGVRGVRRSEVVIEVDAQALASRGISWGQLMAVLRANNQDASGGALSDGKRDVRLLVTGRFRDPARVEGLVLRRGDEGTVHLRDVASVRIDYTEPRSFVRIRGVKMPVFNFQLARGANLLGTMALMQEEFAALNSSDSVLAREGQRLGVNGELSLVQVYNAAEYVEQAISLVQGNMLAGAVIAVIALLLFLRSVRALGIIAVSIPISVIASVAVLTVLGRTINLISLAGFAFSVGMVVDNTIVVMENIYRHLEMGKKPAQAARDGAAEVAGAVFASTLTTLVVFLPVLLIEEKAGQLFRDIALAIMAAVGISLIVSLTVIPSAASRLLRPRPKKYHEDESGLHRTHGIPARVGALVTWLGQAWWRRIAVVVVFTIGTVVGIIVLKPPLDYLPSGNRNLAFGLAFAPPGYSLEQLDVVADRVQERIRPFWEATEDKFAAEAVLRGGPRPQQDQRHPVPVRRPGGPSEVTPPPIEHYFLGSFNGLIFHGAVSADPKRAVDLVPLLEYGTAPDVATDMFGFGIQPPIFRTGGTSGAAISVNLLGDDLDAIAGAGTAVFLRLMGEFGPGAARPSPANFLLRTPQVRVIPNDERLQEVGLDRRELAAALQAAGDGIRLVKSFADGSELKDVRIFATQSQQASALDRIGELPIATPAGRIVDLASIAEVRYERVADEIQRLDRERAVTIEVTPPEGVPLEAAVATIDRIVDELRAAGAIPPNVAVSKTGSAGNLSAIKQALAGDGSFIGLISSSLFLSLLVVFLVMVVLFQSWLQPLVIMVAVPLATFGGFLGLGLLHWYSLSDRYTPVINLDVLTLLGFVILAGVVVNNAILIVTQAQNLRILYPRADIPTVVGEATASRVRPIAMSMMTSIGGMLPLVLMPGSGSELYRGLAAVMVGGLALSTVFTLVLVPVLLEIVLDMHHRKAEKRNAAPALLILLAGGLLTAQGCAVGPDYRGPETDPAAEHEWQLEADNAFTIGETSATWWTSFNDPQLDALISQGMQANRNIAASLARLEAARQQLIAISREDLPTLDAIAGAQRARTSGDVPLDGGSAFTGNRFTLGLALSWEVDLWGKVRRQTEAADATVGIALADLDAVAVSLRAAIAEQYVRLRELQARIDAGSKQAAVLGESVELARARLEAGLGTALDVAQTESLHQEVRAGLTALARTHDEIRTSLSLLLGQGPGTLPEELAERIAIPSPPSQIAVAIPADLLRRRPDLRRAERALARQTAQIGVATADLYPTLTLTGSFGTAAAATGSLFTDPSLFWSAGVGITAPLFDRTRLKALVKVEEAGLEAVVADFEQAVLVALKDVQDALTAYGHETRRRDRLASALESQERAVVLAEDAYDAGITDYQRVLDTRRAVILLQDRYYGAEAARSLAVIGLYRAMGGAWKMDEVE